MLTNRPPGRSFLWDVISKRSFFHIHAIPYIRDLSI